MKIKLLVLGFLLFAVPVRAATLTLTWEEYSGNEDGFKIERRLGNTGAFTEIGQVGVDTTSFVDTTSDDKVALEKKLISMHSLKEALPSLDFRRLESPSV